MFGVCGFVFVFVFACFRFSKARTNRYRNTNVRLQMFMNALFQLSGPGRAKAKANARVERNPAALTDDIYDPAPESVRLIVAADEAVTQKVIKKTMRQPEPTMPPPATGGSSGSRDPPKPTTGGSSGSRDPRPSTGGSSGSRDLPSARQPRKLVYSTDQQRVRDAIGEANYDVMKENGYAIYFDSRIGAHGAYSARFKRLGDKSLKTVPGSMTKLKGLDDDSHADAILEVFNDSVALHLVAGQDDEDIADNVELPPQSDSDGDPA